MGELYEAMSKRGSDPEEAAELRGKAKAYYAKAHAQKPRQITTIYSLSRMYHEDGEDAEARAVLADAKNLYYSAVCSVSKYRTAFLTLTVVSPSCPLMIGGVISPNTIMSFRSPNTCSSVSV